MSDQILPMSERMPTDIEEQRKFCIQKIEEIQRRANMEMEPWVDMLERIYRITPQPFAVNMAWLEDPKPKPPTT